MSKFVNKLMSDRKVEFAKTFVPVDILKAAFYKVDRGREITQSLPGKRVHVPDSGNQLLSGRRRS